MIYFVFLTLFYCKALSDWSWCWALNKSCLLLISLLVYTPFCEQKFTNVPKNSFECVKISACRCAEACIEKRGEYYETATTQKLIKLEISLLILRVLFYDGILRVKVYTSISVIRSFKSSLRWHVIGTQDVLCNMSCDFVLWRISMRF